MARLSRFVDALDRVTPLWLLVINALLAFLVLVAHSSWLLLVRSGKGVATQSDIDQVYLTIPLAAIALMLALAGFAMPAVRVWVLRTQTVMSLFFALFMLQLAWTVVANGAPEGGRFAWDPVLFAFLCAYPVYLARRMLFPTAAARQVLPRYSHIIVFAASFIVSALVLYHAAP